MPASHSGEREASSGSGNLTIRLFGPMEVEVGGSALPRLRSRKGKWLLAILALRSGRDVDREWLAGTLWPDDHAAAAKHSLRQTISDLRAALGDESWRLTSEAAGSLRLNLQDAWVDALEFDALIARGDAVSLNAAVQLYRGPLLEDCPVEWALEARATREESYYRALRTLATDASAHRDFVSSVGYLRRAAEAQPFDENVLRALMEALCGAGDAPEALIAFRKFRELLWREMGISPSEGTTGLYRRILHRRKEPPRPPASSNTPGRARSQQWSALPTRPAPRPRPLPVPLNELIGREGEVRELRDRLERCRLITLTGTGGIGKTRLALQIAAELQHELEGGAVFVDLTSITDAAVVPDSVRQALGLPEAAAGREVEEILSDYLAPRESLLVLDNCERLVPACASLANKLLGRCPGLKILATSRHALGMLGEAVFRVPSLALPPADSASLHQRPGERSQDALSFPAIRLFVERARASASSFDLAPGTTESVVAICSRLDGLPLAIELAAARVRSIPVNEVYRRLQNDFSLLQGGAAWGIDRHQTLRAAFDWSWNLLLPAERETLAALSVFAGGWTLEAAEAVCVTDDGGGTMDEGSEGSIVHRPSSVLDVLTSLVDKSLVVYVPSTTSEGPGAGGTGRYRLLETVRQFAEEKLAGSGQRDAMMRRYCDYYDDWTNTARDNLVGMNTAYWFQQFEIEHDNLRAAIVWWRARGEIEDEIRLIAGLGRFWDTHGHLREGRAYLESGIARMTPDITYPLRAWILGQAAWAALAQADYAAARRHYLQALALYRAEGNHATVGSILNYLACIAVKEERLEEARAQFEESLLLARESGHPGTMASVLNNKSELEILTGNLQAAEEDLTEAASVCIEAGSMQLLGIVYANLSETVFRAGRFHDAKEHCTASLRCIRDAGALVNLPGALRQMAVVCGELGAPDRTARLLGAAAANAEALGVPPSGPVVPDIARAAAAARDVLGTEEFEALYASGQALSPEQAVEYALGGD